MFRHVCARQDAFLADLKEYLSHPSVSTDGTGIRAVAQLLATRLRRLGFASRLVESPGHPFVLGHRMQDPRLPTILLYGHYDVQPPEPLSAWTTPPFEPSIRDGRIYARGVGDNKGQHLAHLLAMEAHLDVHGALPCNVVMLLEGEEEVGSPNVADFVRAHRDELHADAVIISDGARHESGRPVIKYGVRGLLLLELRARGARRDLHSGNFGGVAPNPVWALVHLLATMKSPTGEVLIAGFHDGIRPPTPQELAAVRELPLDSAQWLRDLGLRAPDQPVEREHYSRLMFHPTLNISGIRGGHAGEGMKTVIPSEASVRIDVRLVAGQSADAVFDCIDRHVRRHAGTEIELIRSNSVAPSRTSMESPSAVPIRRAIVAAHGGRPLEYPSGGGTLPLYVFTDLLGTDTFLVPYANHDEANHAPNENMRVDYFFDGIRTSAALLEMFGSCADSAAPAWAAGQPTWAR